MLSLLLAAVVAAPTADAAAYYFNGAGLRGMARGGAWVAGVNDLSAQYYNPAALSRLERPQAYFNMSFVQQQVRFQRTDYNEDGTVRRQFEEITNEAPLMPIPQFSVGHHLGTKKTYLAVGLHPPFAPRLDYPERGPQRYSLQDSLVLQWYAGPSISHQVLPWLSVGAGVFWSPVNASQTLDIMVCRDEAVDGTATRCATDFSDGSTMSQVYNGYDTPEAREDQYAVESDATVGVNMWDWNNITWNVGLLATPTDWLAIGLSAQPAMKVSGKGTLDIGFGDQHWLTGGAESFPFEPIIQGREFQDPDVTVNLTLPWVFRGGVQVTPVERVNVEVDATWQRWNVTKEILVTDVNATITDNPDDDTNTEDLQVTDDISLPANYQDTWTVSLGGDVRVLDQLTVRAGGYWEQSAVPGATQTVAVVDGEKFGYGLGVTGRPAKRWAVEGAFSQTFIVERDISDSQARRQEIPIDLQAALNGEIEANLVEGAVVGNGKFSSQMMYFSFGLTHYFGKGKSKL